MWFLICFKLKIRKLWHAFSFSFSFSAVAASFLWYIFLWCRCRNYSQADISAVLETFGCGFFTEVTICWVEKCLQKNKKITFIVFFYSNFHVAYLCWKIYNDCLLLCSQKSKICFKCLDPTVGSWLISKMTQAQSGWKERLCEHQFSNVWLELFEYINMMWSKPFHCNSGCLLSCSGVNIMQKLLFQDFLSSIHHPINSHQLPWLLMKKKKHPLHDTAISIHHWLTKRWSQEHFIKLGSLLTQGWPTTDQWSTSVFSK